MRLEEVFAPHSPDVERREGRGMPFEEVFKRREEEGTGLEEELAAYELRGTWLEEVFAPHSPDVEWREGRGMPREEAVKRREGEGKRCRPGRRFRGRQGTPLPSGERSPRGSEPAIGAAQGWRFIGIGGGGGGTGSPRFLRAST
jgi:hypothetical protein